MTEARKMWLLAIEVGVTFQEKYEVMIAELESRDKAQMDVLSCNIKGLEEREMEKCGKVSVKT